MINKWKPNTNYYIKINVEKLEEILDDMLIDIMGYDVDVSGLTLSDVARGIKYLEGEEVVINIQISNPMYIKEQGVLDYINEQDFMLAKYYFQTDEFLSQEEYNELIPIDSNIDI